MKYIFLIFFLILSLYPFEVENRDISDKIDYIDYISRMDNINQYREFKEHLGFRESTNRYNIVRSHYWGKYQMGKFARRELEIDIDRSTFLSDTLVQEMAVFELMEQNKQYLSEEFQEFIGDTINDIEITYAGLLASAHLAGYFSVKRYLHSGGKIIRLDGNNISLELYMKEFSNYDFSLTEDIKQHIIINYK